MNNEIDFNYLAVNSKNNCATRLDNFTTKQTYVVYTLEKENFYQTQII